MWETKHPCKPKLGRQDGQITRNASFGSTVRAAALWLVTCWWPHTQRRWQECVPSCNRKRFISRARKLFGKGRFSAKKRALSQNTMWWVQRQQHLGSSCAAAVLDEIDVITEPTKAFCWEKDPQPFEFSDVGHVHQYATSGLSALFLCFKKLISSWFRDAWASSSTVCKPRRTEYVLTRARRP